MFYEISITPSVFQTETYGSRELCESEIRGIWTDLFGSLVIRDLRSGRWHKELWLNKTSGPNLSQKALKALKAENRLCLAPPILAGSPTDSVGWCREAIASHAQAPFSGILSCPDVKALLANEEIVCSILKRHQRNSWWTKTVIDGPSRVSRSTSGYLAALGTLLKTANHLTFMDPHLDPAHRDYRELDKILLATRRTDGVHPKIEIHRVCYLGVKRELQPSNIAWEERFRNALRPQLAAAGLDVEVFIWPDEHDRHILSNLGGIHMGNGLTISNDVNSKTTWTRIPKGTAEDVLRKFDPAVSTPKHRFKIVGT